MANLKFFYGRNISILASFKILFLFLITLSIAGCDLHDCKILEGKWRIQGDYIVYGESSSIDGSILINEATIDTATVNWLNDDNDSFAETLLYYDSDINKYTIEFKQLVSYEYNVSDILIDPKTITKTEFQAVITVFGQPFPLTGTKIED